MVCVNHQHDVEKISLLLGEAAVAAKHVEDVLGNGVFFLRIVDNQAFPVVIVNLVLIGVSGHGGKFCQNAYSL